MNKNVRFEMLTLEGFGLYREKATFSFKEGINSFIGANETGKTTMASGIPAIIFGLTHRQKATSPFNLDRFRNWDNPASCTGSLSFTVDGKLYRIDRNFDNHKVALMELDDMGEPERVIVEGVHNPEARKQLDLYEEEIHRILGVSSQDLFEDVFFLMQPLPEASRISTELQGLLAGSKGGTFQSALDKLENSLKKLTRFTGPNDRGVTVRNFGKDGELENIEKNISTLSASLEMSREATDSLEELQREVIEIEGKLQKVKEELAAKRKVRSAWSEWRLLEKKYSEAGRERSKLREALETVRRFENRISEIDSTLKREYGEFEGTDQTARDDITAMSGLAKSIADAETDISKLEGTLAGLNQAQQKLSEEKEDLKDWEKLGRDPAEKLRTAKLGSDECIRLWQEYNNTLEEYRQLDAVLKQKYTPFENADEDELKRLRNYKSQAYILATERDRAQEAFDIASQKILDLQEEEDIFSREYADMPAIEELDTMLELAGRKWSLLKEENHLKEEMGKGEHKKSSMPLQLATSVAFMLLAVFLTRGQEHIIVGLSTALAFLAGFIVYGIIIKKNLLFRNTEYKAIQSELEKLEELIVECNQSLGAYAGLNQLELADLIQKMKACREDLIELENHRNDISALDIDRLENEAKEKELAEKEFSDNLKVFTDNYDDPEKALAKWDDLKQKQSNLCRKLTEYRSANIDGEKWKNLAEIMRIIHISDSEIYKTHEAFMPFLADLSDSWWQEKTDTAQKLTLLKEELNNLQLRIESQAAGISEKRNALTIQEEEYSRLKDKYKGVLEANNQDAQQVLSRLEQRGVQLNEAGEIRIKLVTLLNSNGAENSEELAARLTLAEDQAVAAMIQWEKFIKDHPGLPEASQADDPEGLQKKIDDLENAVEKLEAEAEKLDHARNEKHKELSKAEGATPINIASAEIELRQLEENRKQMSIRADALTLAYKSIESAIADYSKNYQKRLEEKVTSYFTEISGRKDRRVEFDEQFNIGIVRQGRRIGLDSLSKGARDQLYLSLRFAIADLLTQEAGLPIIFDDPFTSTDEARLERIFRVLKTQETQRQFIILAHSKHYADWGEAVKMGGENAV